MPHCLHHRAWPYRALAGAAQELRRLPTVYVRAGVAQPVQLPDERVAQLREIESEATGQVRTRKGNFYSVRIDQLASGNAPPLSDLLCVPRGLLKKIKQKVLVGDKVKVVGIDWPDAQGMVSDVLPRTSELSDPAVSNIDQILLVFSLSQPPFDPEQATRFLVVAAAAQIPAVVVLNKSDLIPAEECSGIVTEVESWGYTAIPASAHQERGLDSLTKALSGKTSAVAGPSGVGKSSLINALSLLSRLQASDPDRPPTSHHEAAPHDSSSSQASSLSMPNEHSSEGHNGLPDLQENGAAPTLPCSSMPERSQSRPEAENADLHRLDVAHQQQASPAGPTDEDGIKPSGSRADVDTMTSPTSLAQQSAEQQEAHEAAQSYSRTDHDRAQLNGADDALKAHFFQAEPRSQLELAQSRANLQGIDETGGIQQSVGDVTNIGRGRNTTREVTLLEIGDGLLADSPGFNQPSLDELSAANLPEYFPEIQDTLNTASCAFRNCQHLNEPGCGVRPGWSRHLFYSNLHAELLQLEEIQRHRSASKKRREGHIKSKNQVGGGKQQEALLDRKSHRRVSRRQVRQNMDTIIKDAAEDEEDLVET